jgi:outer membrane protein assembly factor BamB
MAVAASGRFVRGSKEKRVIRHSLFFVTFVSVCCLLISGCGPSIPASGSSDFVLISQPSFVKVWDVQVPMHRGDSVKGIYYLDGAVHVLTNNNYDQAVKADSGDLLYNFEIGTPDSTLIGGPTLVTNGIVFPMSHTLELYTRTGNYVRSVDVKYTITNQAVGNHNDVYVGLDFNKGCLAQVDVTQEIDPVQWTFLTFGQVDGPVGIFDNVIYCASEDGKVRACAEDRTPYWPLLTDSAFDTQSEIVSGVAVDSHSCYFSALSGNFYCLDKETGKLKWQYLAGQPLQYGPQVTDTAVYQYVPSLGLVALDKTKKLVIGDQETIDEAPFHSPRWNLRSAFKVLAEDDQFVYVALGSPNRVRGVAAVDKQTGEIKYRTHRRDLAFLTSQPKGELIYGATPDGLVVAMKPVAEPGSYGVIADASSPSFDGLTAHVR